MLQDRILTYSEETKLKTSFDVAKRMLERGMELSEVAEIVELPVDQLQTLIPNS